MTLQSYRKLMRKHKNKTKLKRASKGTPKGPNKTEQRFNRDVLRGQGVFEGITFKIAGGHRYTPDFIVCTTEGVTAYEVKGAYRFPSEGRARLAFDDARERFPAIKFHWYRLLPKGWTDET